MFISRDSQSKRGTRLMSCPERPQAFQWATIVSIGPNIRLHRRRHGRPRKEFDPSLVYLLSEFPERRRYVEAEARSWISAGAQMRSRAPKALRPANAAGDIAVAQTSSIVPLLGSSSLFLRRGLRSDSSRWII